MVYAIQSCTFVGLEPRSVLCEVDLAAQLPTFSLVGLPSSLTQESRERIRSAVVNAGLDWPARKVTINLLPANLPKWGSHFELAMALGVLAAAASESVVPQFQILAIGELSLSGQIRPCGWMAAISAWLASRARRVLSDTGVPLLVIAHEDDIRQLTQHAPGLSASCELAGVATLAAACEKLFEAAARLQGQGVGGLAPVQLEASESPPDFSTLSQVRDEPLGVVAALAAIAGKHHALFAGPHGMGKSMLVRSICEGLSPITGNELSERAALFYTLGQQNLLNDRDHDRRRPVVSLQSNVSRAGLEGSLLDSGQALPGALTRAHLGVLVVDELLEYRRDVIEAFRQPLDEGIVRLQRAKFHAALPARIQLLASTNLCPCGFHGHTRRVCRCTLPRRVGYQAKLSGPLMDRFDLIVLVGRGRGALKSMPIPKDLIGSVTTLADPNEWPRLLDNFAASSSEKKEALEPAEVWSRFNIEVSDRGRLKLARVSKTLARLLGETRSDRHVRLAALIRQDLDFLLRDPLSSSQPIETQCKNSRIGFI